MTMSRRLALLVIMVLAATGLYAQGKSKEPELRTVSGMVVDKQESPVEGAIVYLKDLRTQDVRTYISDNEGRFRFSGLDLNVDYEVHAEHEGMTSPPRSISNFDTRKEMVITLKIDRKKSEK